MPIYEYHCEHCDHCFSALNSLANYESPADCPACGATAPRTIGSAPQLNTMHPGRRQAFQRNERSAHEPRLRQQHACHSHCGCGPKKSAAGQTAAGKVKQQAGKRPWMLGH